MNQRISSEYDEKLDDLNLFITEKEMEICQLNKELDEAYQFIDYLIDRLESNHINTFD
ncbi:MAG: hypothetical protein LBR68_04935 [Lachnoclostridium sp.]|nr:hypothetical protein [Lachnoclostridium sp.]